MLFLRQRAIARALAATNASANASTNASANASANASCSRSAMSKLVRGRLQRWQQCGSTLRLWRHGAALWWVLILQRCALAFAFAFAGHK